MDYCGVGSIKDIMQTCKDTLNEQQATYVIQQTLKGLVYLHSQNILHLDVKSANILVNEEGAVKLGTSYSTVHIGGLFVLTIL